MSQLSLYSYSIAGSDEIFKEDPLKVRICRLYERNTDIPTLNIFRRSSDLVLKHVHIDENFFLDAKNENSPFYLGSPSAIFQVTRLPYSLIRRTKKKNQISYFPYVGTDIVEASLRKSFISLITANGTSCRVPPLSNSPRDLKSNRSLKTKKFGVSLYPRTVFFPEAQAEKADKRS